MNHVRDTGAKTVVTVVTLFSYQTLDLCFYSYYYR